MELEVLRVRLLGGFAVSVGNRRVEEDGWRLRKAASLVKLLALAPGHRLHRERAMDLLWPNLGPNSFVGVENLVGSTAGDVLSGSAVANSLVGGEGADRLLGFGGSDTLNSRDGVSGNDSLDGGAGTDRCVTDAGEASIRGCP